MDTTHATITGPGSFAATHSAELVLGTHRCSVVADLRARRRGDRSPRNLVRVRCADGTLASIDIRRLHSFAPIRGAHHHPEG